MFTQKGYTDKDNERYINEPHGRYCGNAEANVTNKPELGVSVMLVEEYLRRCIDKECHKAAAEFAHMNDVCRKGNDAEILNLKKFNTTLSQELESLRKDYKALVKLNNLIVPERKPVKLTKVELMTEIEDEIEDLAEALPEAINKD